MAIKSFTTGEVLTASDTNLYLNNGGLVYIGAYTASAATLFIDSCFTSTYDNYLVTLQTTSVSTTGSFEFKLRLATVPSSTNYFFGGWQYYTNIASTAQQSGGAAATSMIFSAASGTGSTFAAIQVSKPKYAEPTAIMVDFTSSFSNYVGGQIRGLHSNTTAYDGFQITSNTGATITGTIRVFGVRQA